MKRILILATLPLVAAANMTPTNAYRHGTMPAYGKGSDSALPLQNGADNAERRAEILAGARLDAPHNWYAPMFATTNPPAPSAPIDPVWADTLLLPVGVYPVLRTAPTLQEIMLADEGVCRSIVARFRDGRTAATNIAVRINHGGEVVGRVMDLFFVPGDGVWGRLCIERAVVESRDWWQISPELMCLSKVVSDDWGEWGRLRIPRYIEGVALCTDASIPELSRRSVTFAAEPAAAYPTRYIPHRNR